MKNTMIGCVNFLKNLQQLVLIGQINITYFEDTYYFKYRNTGMVMSIPFAFTCISF